MPLLNGIDAVKQIMAHSPTAILMFSSLTHQGAKATLDALEAGALDFLPKKFNEIAKTTSDAGSVLRERVLEIARKKGNKRTSPAIRASRSSAQPLVKPRSDASTSNITPSLTPIKSRKSSSFKASGKDYRLLAIGTSTGGPVALQKILTQLPADFPLPIVMVQHMPAAFTSAFASRLDSLCKISVKEAANGDILKPGHAYLAPGGLQMLIEGKESNAKIKIIEDDSARMAFKPSVDVTFGTAAKVYAGNVLGIILTGMGSDGREGSRMLKAKGATIWAQDEETCVVYGMPQAVANAGISTLDVPLLEFPKNILKEIAS